MPPPISISPSLLGSSHWITNDIAGLSKVMDGLNVPGDKQPEIKPDEMPKMIEADSVFTSLAAGPKGTKIDSLVAGARLMGDKIKPMGEAVHALHKPATQIAKKLGFDIDEVVRQVALLNRQYDPKAAENLQESLMPRELEAARMAVDKVLLSRDFMRMAVEDDTGEAFRNQGGLVALANTSLGVMKMIREGTIPADSLTIDIVDGQVYDISKPGDMLKLAVETGSKVREMFVDEANLKLIRSEYKGNQADVLGRKIQELIEARREVTKKLDFSDLKASSEGEVDDRLKEARERLRSFRYDMDRHAGVKMSFGESFRRWADNFFRGKFYTVSQQAFEKIKSLEAEITGLLTGQEDIPAFNLSVETYRDAAQLSHRTNTLIRHCRSGYAAEQQNFAKKVHEIFDPLVATGGKKTVYFEVGATARAGINATKALQLDVNGKVGYRHKVDVSIERGGGQVTVRTSDGGVAEGGAKFGIGHAAGDWDPETARRGDSAWGAKVGAKANLSALYTRETKYPNLDEFIKATGRHDMIVQEDTGLHVLGLNKIIAAVKWVGRKLSALPRALGLIERRDLIDAKAIRDNFRTSGLLSNTDRLLTSPTHQHALLTQKKKYTLFEAGVDGSINAGLDLLSGFKSEAKISDKGAGKDDAEPETTAVSGSVLSLEAGIGGKYQREAFASGSLLRTRVSSLRLHSNPYLQHEIEAMKWQLPEDFAYLKDLQTEEGDLSQLAKDLNGHLAKLEGLCEGYDSSKSAEDWRGVARALNLLACHFVRLENRIKADILNVEDSLAADPDNAELQTALAGRQRDLADLKAFFEKRLTTPDIAIPEKIFEETMLDRVADEKNKYSTYSGHIMFGYTAGVGWLQEEVKNLGDGKTFTDATVDNVISSAGDSLGLSNKVDGHLSVKKAHEDNDLRPWKHGRTTTISLRFDSHMPVRELINMLAEKYVDSFGEDENPPSKEEVAVGMLSEFAVAFGMGTLVQGTIGSAIGEPLKKAMENGEAPGPLLDFLSKPVVEATTGVLQYSGIDVGMNMSFQQTMEWQWYNGRLTNMAIHDEQSSSQKIGARFQVLPNMGVGVYLESGGSLDRIMRVGYAKPPVDAILARTEDLLGTGSPEPLKAFYAHNKKGMLRLYDVFRDANVTALQDKYDVETEEKVPEDYQGDKEDFLQDRKAFLDHLAGLTKAFARIDQNLSTRLQDSKKLDFADRVTVARDALLRAVKVMGDEHRTDAQKLNALRQLMTAIVGGYKLVLEAAESLGLKDLAKTASPVDKSPVQVDDSMQAKLDAVPHVGGTQDNEERNSRETSDIYDPVTGKTYNFLEYPQGGARGNHCFFLSSLHHMPGMVPSEKNARALREVFKNMMAKVVENTNNGAGPVVFNPEDASYSIDNKNISELFWMYQDNLTAFTKDSRMPADVAFGALLTGLIKRPVVMVTFDTDKKDGEFQTFNRDLLTGESYAEGEPVYIHFIPGRIGPPEVPGHFQALELTSEKPPEGPLPQDAILNELVPEDVRNDLRGPALARKLLASLSSRLSGPGRASNDYLTRLINAIKADSVRLKAVQDKFNDYAKFMLADEGVISNELDNIIDGKHANGQKNENEIAFADIVMWMGEELGIARPDKQK